MLHIVDYKRVKEGVGELSEYAITIRYNFRGKIQITNFLKPLYVFSIL